MSNEFVAIMVFIIILALWLVLTIISKIADKKHFNNGYCPRCNLKWRLFDFDGGRGFICDKCNQIIWTSWPGMDKENK